MNPTATIERPETTTSPTVTSTRAEFEDALDRLRSCDRRIEKSGEVMLHQVSEMGQLFVHAGERFRAYRAELARAAEAAESSRIVARAQELGDEGRMRLLEELGSGAR